VIGLSIYRLQTGEKIGIVSDLLFNDASTFLGVLLEGSGLFKPRKYIPTEKIVSLGRDAVIVEKGAKPLALNDIKKRWVGVLSGQRHLKGRPVLLSTGNEIGSIEGVYFMEEVGTLIGYELSNGLINDFRRGRKILKTQKPLVWGDDVCIAMSDEVELKDI
jgi:uncharacterized protein YrrD